MARPYTLGKRALSAAGTRGRILDATLDLFVRDGVDAANISAVADQAGVTRATVYAHCASPHELLLAVLNDALDRVDVRQVRKSLQHPDPATAARLLMRTSCRFWFGERDLFARVKGLARSDPRYAVLDELKEDVRAGHLRNLAYRLKNQRCLRPGVSEGEARATLLLLTSLETFDHCTRRRGLSLDATIRHLTRILDGALLV